jgi:uncharacterized membrane protein YraQ (UPF0718 family)/YHS domain-containing protein
MTAERNNNTDNGYKKNADVPRDPICGMKVNKKTGLKLAHEGQTFYFCSGRCMEKFASENNISEEKVESAQPSKRVPVYRNKTFIVSSILIAAAALSYAFPLLSPFKESLLAYVEKIWWAVLLGLLLGGIIDHYIPREYISHILARPKRRTIFYSVIIGFLMSACSHGILALSIQLYKKGASNASVVAFLLASPWANMTLTIMLIGFFGLKAVFIVFSAVVIAIITGFIFQLLQVKNIIEENPNAAATEEDFSITSDLKHRVRGYKLSFEIIKSDLKGIFRGSIALSNMVLWWILIGVGLASAARAYVPSSFFTNYMDASIAGLFVTLAFATIIEVCSEGSAPIAFELFKQTGAFGNGFVFLMAGVVTDYTEIGLLWQNLGKRTALFLPLVAVPQVILMGFIANVIF